MCSLKPSMYKQRRPRLSYQLVWMSGKMEVGEMRLKGCQQPSIKKVFSTHYIRYLIKLHVHTRGTTFFKEMRLLGLSLTCFATTPASCGYDLYSLIHLTDT